LLGKTIGELGLGCFENLVTATLETPLIDILGLMQQHRISSVPIVDKAGGVVNVYEKYDMWVLAQEGFFYDLETPVLNALSKRPPVWSVNLGV
jgi:5'-AMP-activated protein kinase regulatory gamma subunit